MKTKIILLISFFALISMQLSKKPRVLLIGDSVSKGYANAVTEELKSEADVSYPRANCGSTRIGLRDLDKWIGDTAWTVIHFNFGLHDLGYRFTYDSNRNEKGEYATPFNGGHLNVPVDEYEKNLRQLVARLMKTGAKLIFATTTPVSADLHSYIKDSELPYNNVALKVMRDENIKVNDLWGFSKPRIDSLQIPGNPHFTANGSKVLAQKIALSIREALKNK
jgi:hypothetical protein